jgi:NADH-quinone oxidoreductase subunit N
MFLIYFLLIPEIYFFFFISFFLFSSILYNLSSYYKFIKLYKFDVYISIIGLINLLFMCLNMINIDYFYIYSLIYKDNFILLIQIYIIIMSVLLLIISLNYININKFINFEFIILILFSIFGLFILVISNDLSLLYLSLELQSICFYILTSFNKNNPYSIESGLKYFILGSFSSIILLFGISILYGYSGLLSLSEINLFISAINIYYNKYEIYLIYISLILIIISILFKLYAAPFHFWISDIYQGSLTLLTTYFSIIPTIPIFFILNKLLIYIFNNFYIIYIPLIIFSIINSIFLGTLGALYQKKIKRILAYSSITTTGYLLISFINENPLILYNIYFYIFSYSLSIFSVFIFFMNLFLNKNKFYVEQISTLNGYVQINKYNSYILLFCIFSISGLPPFPLFISKFLLLINLANIQNYLLVFLILFTSIISIYYYIYIVKVIFFNKKNKWLFFKNPNFFLLFILILFLILQIIIFFKPSLIINFIEYSFFILLNYYVYP